MARFLVFFFGLVVVSVLLPVSVFAHCDTYSGPVIEAAKRALDKGDVTPLLKWVPKKDESIIKEAFAKTVKVRGKGPEVKEIADNYFLETLVRIHRAGEGFPFTGLKNEPPEPVVALADKALEIGVLDTLSKKMTLHFTEELKQRFTKVLELKKTADKSVDAGREYVAAYIEYLHLVEGVHSALIAGRHHEFGKQCDADKK